MLKRRLLSCVVVPFLVAACSHTRPMGDGVSSADDITEEEIATISASNAYEVIRRLRGNFLSVRGRTTLMGTSSAEPTVYVDDQAYGPVSSLRTIPASQVAHIRLYRSWEATTKYGTGNMGGVIAVTTKR
jgi:hypothetical protein